MRACQIGTERVFDDSRQCRIGHDESTETTTLKLVSKQAEGVGIALEVGDVIPEARAHLFLQVAARSFCEETLYRLLATMSERRIAHIVGKSCSLHYRTYLLEECPAEVWVSIREDACHVVAQRLSQR